MPSLSSSLRLSWPHCVRWNAWPLPFYSEERSISIRQFPWMEPLVKTKLPMLGRRHVIPGVDGVVYNPHMEESQCFGVPRTHKIKGSIVHPSIHPIHTWLITLNSTRLCVAMRIRGCVSLATILYRPPPLSCLHSLLMRFNDARAAAVVLIVTPGSG